MSKYKKQSSGLYRTSVFTGKYKDDGKPIKKYLSAKTQADLDRKVREAHLLIDEGLNVTDGDITFGRYAERWLTSYKANKGIRTQEMYRRCVRTHLKGLADIKVKDIKRIDVQSQITALKEHPRTAEQVRLTAKQIFDAAIEDDIIHKNPCRDIDMPRHVKEEKRALTEEEKKAVKSADLDARQRAFVSILYGTGMRPAEMYALTWSDIDFQRCEISVNKSLTFKDGSAPVVVYPKTNSGIRTIQCPLFVFKALQEYRVCNRTLTLFGDDSGRYKRKQAYYWEWELIKRKIEEALGHQTDLSMYCFRHGYCTTLWYSGISLLEAQRLMGHSSYEMILKIYSHLDAEKENTKDKINRIAF